MIFKVYFKKIGWKKSRSLEIKTSSSVMAAKIVLNNLTKSWLDLGEYKITKTIKVIK